MALSLNLLGDHTRLLPRNPKYSIYIWPKHNLSMLNSSPYPFRLIHIFSVLLS